MAGGVGITAILPYFKDRLETGEHATLIWLVKDTGQWLTEVSCWIALTMGNTALIRILVECLETIPNATAQRLQAVEMQDLRAPKASIRIHLTKTSSSAKSTRLPSQCCRISGDERESDPLLCSADVPLLASSDKLEDTVNCIKCLTAVGRQRGFDVQFDSSGIRPNLDSLLPTTASERSDVSSEVICCGPAELCDAVRVISTENNLVYHEEAFDW